MSNRKPATRDFDRPRSLAPQKTPTVWRRKNQSTQTLPEAFSNAFSGLQAAFVGERNFKIHCALTIFAVIAGFALKLDPVSWVLLVFAIGLVMTAELLNTAIERVVDIASEGEFSALARDAKDIAAGGVLLSSIAAAIIGLILFVPRVIALLQI